MVRENLPSSQGASLADSPWFWMTVFGGMGLAAALVITPKYLRRMQTIERKQEVRQAVWEESVRAGDDRSMPTEAPLPAGPGSNALQVPALTLIFLVGGVTIVGAAGLTWQRMRRPAGREPPVDP
jgi:hypothetical protein